MGTFRAVAVACVLTCYTAPLMPVQAALRRVWRTGARHLPYHFHRGVCRVMGIRITIVGTPIHDGGCLMAANHSSWLDIPVLSACAPVSFVAKKEVYGWPVFGTLARLQRTLFVDRDRRSSTATFKAAMQHRLAEGDHIVLFPEGTSSDGNRVLPFKSALMGAADVTVPNAAHAGKARVQPVSVAYTRLHGVPMGRRLRPLYAWYGGMEMGPHFWGVLKRGPLDVEVHFHDPVTMDDFPDRKALTRHCHDRVAAGLRRALRGRPDA